VRPAARQHFPITRRGSAAAGLPATPPAAADPTRTYLEGSDAMPPIEMIGILIPILAILLGGLIVLIPVIGFTARFALKPTVEAYARLRQGAAGGQEQIVAVLDQRIAMMERQIDHLETTVRGLEDRRDFDQRLAAGEPPRSAGVAEQVPVFRPES